MRKVEIMVGKVETVARNVEIVTGKVNTIICRCYKIT